MVVEYFPDFFEWLFRNSGTSDQPAMGAIYIFLFLVLACALLGTFFGYLAAALRHGPFEAFYVVAKVVAGAGPDWFRMSPRRIWAIARLAAKEALRRRVILVAFGIFAIALLFGGWFINSGSEHPERVYINFVMWGTQLLILMMIMLISAFSLPDDIKNRTIYTVATKPVRTSEIVLGRVVGFGLLGTALLFLMGVISLLFVWRGLSHTHQATLQDGRVELNEVNPLATGHRASELAVKETQTELDSGHFHYVEIIQDVRDKNSPPPSNPAGIIRSEERGDQVTYWRAVVVPRGGHTHQIAVDGDLDNLRYTLSDAKGFYRARVPKYADRLVFYDRQGEPKDSGINTGDQWTYRGYITGGITLSKAEYYFSDFREDLFADPNVVPLELTLGVFRSTMGEIGQRVKVGLRFESVPSEGEAPARFYRSEIMEFESQEFQIQVKGIPRKLPGQAFDAGGEIRETGYFDLFDDFAANGQLRLVIRCQDMGQYVGLARADVYFRGTDQAHWWNFAKGYMGIWLQMMIVCSLGVAFSTFLSAPVTMLAAICTIIFGFFSDGIQKISAPGVEGGGPIESLIRLVTQKNMQQPLQESIGLTIIQRVDQFFMNIVSSISGVVPNFGKMDFSAFLTYGYFVDNSRLLVALCMAATFCIGLTILGYFCLKTRELAG